MTETFNRKTLEYLRTGLPPALSEQITLEAIEFYNQSITRPWTYLYPRSPEFMTPVNGFHWAQVKPYSWYSWATHWADHPKWDPKLGDKNPFIALPPRKLWDVECRPGYMFLGMGQKRNPPKVFQNFPGMREVGIIDLDSILDGIDYYPPQENLSGRFSHIAYYCHVNDWSPELQSHFLYETVTPLTPLTLCL